MEAALSWVALGVSLAGLLFATLVPSLWLSLPASDAGADGDPERPVVLRILRWGAALAALLFVATLPSRPPWAAGQAMGIGFLMGAASALLAVALTRHLRARVIGAAGDPSPAALQLTGICAGVGLLSLATLPLAAAPLLFTRGILDALGGIALGAVLVAVLGRVMLGLGSQASAGVSDGLLLQGWGAFAATLAGALAFGFYHFQAADGAGRVAPLALASALILAAAATVGLFAAWRGPVRAFVGAAVLSAVVVGVLALVTLPRLVAEAGAAGCVLLGIGTAVLAGVLAAAGARLPGGRYWRESAGIAALMVLGLYAVAFQWLRGYGVGLALMGAWAVAGPELAALSWSDLARAAAGRKEEPEEAPRLAAAVGSLHQVLSVALLALLFRLFLERYRPLATDLSLTVHFTLIGMVVGAVAPALFAGVVERAAMRRRLEDAPPAAGVGFWLAGGIAFWSVAVPTAVGVAWGMRSLVGLLAGLLVAGIYTLLTPPEKEGNARSFAALAGLLGAILMALAVVQMGHLLAPLGVLHRGIRVAVLGGVAALGILALAAGARAGRPPREAPLQIERGDLG